MYLGQLRITHVRLMGQKQEVKYQAGQGDSVAVQKQVERIVRIEMCKILDV